MREPRAIGRMPRRRRAYVKNADNLNDVVRRFSDARLGKADRTMPCLPCTGIFIAYWVAARPHFDRVVVVADGVADVGL